MTVLFPCRDVAFMLVAIWACAGIAVKHAAVGEVSGAATAVATLGLLLIGARLWRWRSE